MQKNARLHPMVWFCLILLTVFVCAVSMAIVTQAYIPNLYEDAKVQPDGTVYFSPTQETRLAYCQSFWHNNVDMPFEDMVDVIACRLNIKTNDVKMLLATLREQSRAPETERKLALK